MAFLRDTSWAERLHLGRAAVYAALLYPGIRWWSESIIFLIFLSIAALVEGCIAAFQGAKAERNSPDA